MSHELADQIRLEMTCTACPEQYDAYLGDQKVGYLRLRHGYFTVRTGLLGDIIYQARPEGDGAFYPHERDNHLWKARKAIAKHVKERTE